MATDTRPDDGILADMRPVDSILPWIHSHDVARLIVRDLLP